MWCVIPAAGRGTRMRGFPEDRAKALLDLAGRTVLQRLLDALPDAVTHVCVIVGDRDTEIEQHVRAFEKDRALCTSVQAEPLGVADAVYRARECVDGPFLTLMGDAFFSAPLGRFVERWRAGGRDGAVLTESRLESDDTEMGLLEIGGGEVARLWKGTPRGETVRIAGAFILPPTFFGAHERLASETEPEYEIEDVIDRLIRGGQRFAAVPYGGWRRNINTPRDVALVKRELAAPG